MMRRSCGWITGGEFNQSRVARIHAHRAVAAESAPLSTDLETAFDGRANHGLRRRSRPARPALPAAKAGRKASPSVGRDLFSRLCPYSESGCCPCGGLEPHRPHFVPQNPARRRAPQPGCHSVPRLFPPLHVWRSSHLNLCRTARHSQPRCCSLSARLGSFTSTHAGTTRTSPLHQTGEAVRPTQEACCCSCSISSMRLRRVRVPSLCTSSLR